MKNIKVNLLIGSFFLIASIVIYFEQRAFSNNILLVCAPTFIGSFMFLTRGLYLLIKNKKSN